MTWPIIKKDNTPPKIELFFEKEEPDWLRIDQIPPWRQPSEEMQKQLPWSKRLSPAQMNSKDQKRGIRYVVPPLRSQHNINAYHQINAALMLRRPLLVKGVPGIGKSSLAYYIACMLGLGKPLVWPINSKTTLQSGLYHYDAVGHLGARILVKRIYSLKMKKKALRRFE